MGCDIFLRSVISKTKEKYEAKHQQALLELKHTYKDEGAKIKAQAKAEKFHELLYPSGGYYRENYDGTSLLFRLKLNWQEPRILKLISPTGLISVENIQKLITIIESRTLKLPNYNELIALRIPVKSEQDVIMWHKYFKAKRGHLLRLLKKAVKLNEPLRISV